MAITGSMIMHSKMRTMVYTLKNGQKSEMRVHTTAQHTVPGQSFAIVIYREKARSKTYGVGIVNVAWQLGGIKFPIRTVAEIGNGITMTEAEAREVANAAWKAARDAAKDAQLVAAA